MADFFAFLLDDAKTYQVKVSDVPVAERKVREEERIRKLEMELNLVKGSLTYWKEKCVVVSKAIEAMEDGHKEEIDALVREHADEVKALEDRGNKTKKNFTALFRVVKMLEGKLGKAVSLAEEREREKQDRAMASQGNLTAMLRVVKVLEGKLVKAVSLAEEREREKQELDTTVKTLDMTIYALERDLEKQDEKIEELETEKKNLEDSLETEVENNRELEGKIAELETELESKEEELENKIAELEMNKQDLEEVLETELKYKKKLEDKIAELETELKDGAKGNITQLEETEEIGENDIDADEEETEEITDEEETDEEIPDEDDDEEVLKGTEINSEEEESDFELI